MKTTTTLGKQKNLIIVLLVLAVIFAVMCIVFPFVFKEKLNTVYAKSPLGDAAEAVIYDKANARSIKGDIESIRKGEAKNTLSLEEGDGEKVLYTFRKNDVEISYQPYIFPEIPLEKLARVNITNGHGSFSVYNDGKGNFFFEGAEANLYNSRLVSTLLLQARYMLADGYVENPSSPSDYGLGKDNYSAKVEVISTDGVSNTVYVGSGVIDGNRYYMKHADKEHIYIMDSGASAFFDDIRTYLSADVIRAIEEQQRNYIEKFEIKKNGDRFFACEIIPDEERVGAFSNQLHRMTYPSDAQVLNTTTLYEMFANVGGLTGAGVIEYGVSKKENPDEIFSLYGLDNPAFEITFSLSGTSYDIIVGNPEEVDGEGYYYVYSNYQDTVVLVPASSLVFLEYDILDLFQDNVFQYNISTVSSIELKYGGNTRNFVLSGEGESLTVSESVSGKSIDTPSFRQFYISLLNVTLGGYSSVEGSVADTRKHELSFVVTLESGEKLVYEFYSESTMNCHIIIDGKGGFKTDRKWVDKIIENAEKLLSGIAIESAF